MVLRFVSVIFMVCLTQTLCAQDACQIEVANTVTLDCKNGNDYQLILSSNCIWEEFEIKIFNRWGELLYSSKDINEVWDASKVPTGVYVYTLQAITIDNLVLDKQGYMNVLH